MAVDFEGCARPTPARVPMPGLWSLRTLRRGALRLWPPRDGILRVQYCTRAPQGASRSRHASQEVLRLSSPRSHPSPSSWSSDRPLSQAGKDAATDLCQTSVLHPDLNSVNRQTSPLRRPRPGLLTWARGGGVRLLMPGVQYCTRLAGPESQPQYARPDLVPVSSLPPVHGGMADLMPSGERCRR